MFVSVPPISLLSIANGVPGVGYMVAHLQQEKKSYLKKSTYKQCEPRQKVNNKTLHKAYFSSSFRRKTGSIRPASSVRGSISLQNLF